MSTCCAALFITAPASGQGKTTVTALLAYYYRNQGLNVRVFKCGPDYIDPQFHAIASGNPVYQLDLWMIGESACRTLLHQAAQQADVILIEGVMGLFDGTPSSADLAERFGIPLLAVIDAAGMAQTFGALVHGLASYRPGLSLIAAVANQVASAGHAAMLAESLPDTVKHFAYLQRECAFSLPERHLGLYLAEEISDLEQQLEKGLASLEISSLASLPQTVTFPETNPDHLPRLLDGVRIGIAKDPAFAFIYQANLDLLEQLGAELHFFSPLHDDQLPDVDSVWLPGGYPELHLQQLADNQNMQHSIAAYHRHGKPIIAECGGMLYLLESLQDQDGHQASMVNILPGQGIMQKRLAGLGMQEFILEGNGIKGHTFHYSTIQNPDTAQYHATRQRDGKQGEAIYLQKGLYASYLHLYFPSNPQITAKLFKGEML